MKSLHNNFTDKMNFFLCFSHRRNAAHGFSLIPVDSLKVSMKEILQKAMKKRKGSQKGAGKEKENIGWMNGFFVKWSHTPALVSHVALTNPGPPTGPMYRLEKQTEPNVSVDLESTLESQNTLEFCLVRENSGSRHKLQQLVYKLDLHVYACMRVYTCPCGHKWRWFERGLTHGFIARFQR